MNTKNEQGLCGYQDCQEPSDTGQRYSWGYLCKKHAAIAEAGLKATINDMYESIDRDLVWGLELSKEAKDEASRVLSDFTKLVLGEQ